MKRVGGSRDFPNGMHRPLRDADIYGAYSNLGCGQRSDGAAAGHVAAHDKGLDRHVRVRGQFVQDGAGLAVARIALVGVEFNDHAVVEAGTVVVVVPVGKVRVHAVGIVGRDQHGAGQGASAFFCVRHDAFQHVFEHGATRAGRRRTADLFVIVAHQQRTVFASTGREGLEADETAQQVVQAGRGNKLVCQADELRRLGVIEKQLKVQHLTHIGDTVRFEPFVQERFEIRLFVSLAENGRQIGLGVDRAALVCLPVEMNGQTGDDGDRLSEVEQRVGHLVALTQIADSPGH